MFGRPLRKLLLGHTHVSSDVFMEFLREISPRFTPHTYNLLSHNCNTFTNEASQFLTGSKIPSYIENLPEEFLQTPLGSMLRPMIENMTPGGSNNLSNDSVIDFNSKQGESSHMSSPSMSTKDTSPTVLCDSGKAGPMCKKIGDILENHGKTFPDHGAVWSSTFSLLDGIARAVLSNDDSFSFPPWRSEFDAFFRNLCLPSSEFALCQKDIFPLLDLLRVICLRPEYFSSIFGTEQKELGCSLGLGLVAVYASYPSSPEMPVQTIITALKLAINAFQFVGNLSRGDLNSSSIVLDDKRVDLTPLDEHTQIDDSRSTSAEKVFISACVRNLLSDSLPLRKVR